MTTRPPRVWAEVTGGDALGRGQQPALCWWLPEESSVQHAYQLRTDDGYDTGRVEGAIQSFVRLPVFDRSRRSALAQVKVWTDLGESAWSDPVRLEVVRADAASVPLPCEPFRVVANLPFHRATAILRHLLDDPSVPLNAKG